MGVDYSYHGRSTYENECRKYCEDITSMDRYIGKVLKYLKDTGLDKNTLVIYMGDNGFQWGEHGLIDKRNFYEASVRVPMLAYCPGMIKPGTEVKDIVQNIDIAPTIMEACNVKKAKQMRGFSFLKQLQGKKVKNWRKKIFYEYYWEYDFPHTPTMFGVRTDRYKLIRYQGIWDTNELYDLQNDPYEMNNLIADPDHQDIVLELTNELYDWLEETNGMSIPLKRTIKYRIGDHRNANIY
ncbi:MAG: sulfatase/phosphatase domain-containing protein [Bacteroidales bacterium]